MHLRAEIRSVQSQLKSAIQNHQMIVFKLKDRPVSIKLRVQMCNVQRHIVSLGEKQKKLLTQLRSELETNGAPSKEEKPSHKPLQNLRPNPLHPNLAPKPVEIKRELADLKCESNPGGNENTPLKPGPTPHTSRRKSKLVATLDVPLINGHSVSSLPLPSQKENTPSTTPSTSPTHGGNSIKQPKQSLSRISKPDTVQPSSTSDESQDAYIHLPADPETRKKLQFMTALSLVTREVLAELQNRRTERKRRSTANPHFNYGYSSDQKRKKTIYLANNGAVTLPTTDVSSNIMTGEDKSQQSLCMSCSSAEGSLSDCILCHKAFHWNCVYGDAVPVPDVQALKCQTCQQGDQPTSEACQQGDQPTSEACQQEDQPTSEACQQGDKSTSQTCQQGDKPNSQACQQGDRPTSSTCQQGDKPSSQTNGIE